MPLYDLSARAKLRVTGNDRVRFLNGQMTNDVRKANAQLALPACILNAKGKVDAFVFIHAGPDEVLLDADPELREKLAPRLERYIIADDVTLEDVTETCSLFHVTGETAPSLPNDTSWQQSNRLGAVGWDLFAPAAEHEQLLQSLSAFEPKCDAEEAERTRIESGIPRWGRELTDQIIPVEANLESVAIDYAKGCYIGQEVISRMKMSGQTNKRLCGLVATNGAALAAEMRLFSLVPEGKEVGWITSATRSDRLNKEIALGFVKRGANEIGTHLAARAATGAALEAEVVALPFR